MLKKNLALLLSLSFFLFLFSSCSASRVSVNGSKIDNEIYEYFKDKADKENSADTLLLRYVAINSKFNEQGLKISSSEKAALSSDADDIWHLYSAYYTEKGISKAAIYKAELSNLYYTILLENYYSSDGQSPVAEDDIKDYFKNNYAVIRYVTGYLFNEDENGIIEMTDEQKKSVSKSFTAAAEMINNGSSIEESIASLNDAEIRYAIVTSTDSAGFPDDFFEKIKDLEVGKAAAVTSGSYIFLVLREDGEKGDYASYTDSRLDCLKAMKSEEFEKIVSSWAKAYTIDN